MNHNRQARQEETPEPAVARASRPCLERRRGTGETPVLQSLLAQQSATGRNKRKKFKIGEAGGTSTYIAGGQRVVARSDGAGSSSRWWRLQAVRRSVRWIISAGAWVRRGNQLPTPLETISEQLFWR